MLLVEQFPVLIVTTGVFAGYTILIAGLVNRKSCAYIFLSVVFSHLIMSLFILHHVLTVGTIHYWLGGWRPPWGIEYVVDALNAYILVIVLFLSLMAGLYAKRYEEHKLEERKHVTYFTLFQLLVAGLCGVVVTGDVFNMYVLSEIVALTAYALIASPGGRTLKASYNYLVMGSVGICFYLLGIGFLYSVTGTLNMADMRILLPPLYQNRLVFVAYALILVGFSIKMALIPLHTWLPDAHAFAPSEISAMLSGIIIEVYTYAFIRISFSVFTVDFLRLLPIFDIISWIAAIAIIYGSVLAIAQINLKRMLAYSSVSQMGYIMLGVGLSISTRSALWGGLTPALMHILNHALMKGCLFLVAGAFIYKFNAWNITDLRGLGRKMPWTCGAFVLAAISMIGVPPSVGFVTKVYLIFAFVEAGNFIFMAILLLSALLNLVYFWRVIEILYMRPGGEEGHSEHHAEHAAPGKSEEIPLFMLIPVVTLASLCMIMGIVWLTEIPIVGAIPILDNVNKLFGLGAYTP
ncbi:MAG: monovalent cation/H+ antiporter subunit D family protein [Methanophagales archaeon ANME-1-THS]|nr:MAG: monovalent cation/H+ antiporter subunit D family protein [Methanophagales archaeon ANME-1-THS]